ncbi:hypothetical protein BGW36DRAFT_301671 [Talaromyces proteolyticus]|uniref:Uncharacterized protein n=1 Tax=Talaromyces proteolyticus TaxID=1131652 RepID=A0AAD4KHU8_9EURO|nr:uncharacterized protein BGW36DRAFT_301671 [Talaromyces proteolyticus]KAH8692797.1 hypothetical protein BGW36DRAFT_301671 [Talaromyces proteolyticus]
MDGSPPPPPPPHGANPNTTEGTPKYRRSTDLPDGPYDIFVVPPHSAGAGFIYLPSLQCHRNSFIAGSLSTLFVVAVWITIQPTVKTWMVTTTATGGMGVVIIILAVGFGGWYFGTMQGDGGPNGSTGGRPRRPGSGFGSGYQYNAHQNQNGTFPGGGPAPGSQYSAGGHFNTGGPSPQSPPHNQHNAHTNTGPKEDSNKANAEWERAREETKRKEEIRRKMEEYKRKREEEEAKKKLQKEREALEKELRERREQLEKEAAAAKAAAEKEVRERAEREAAEREEKAKKEAAEKEAAAKEAAKKEAAARFAAAKDAAAKRFAAAKEAAATKAKGAQGPASAPSAAPPRTPSPQKPPKPTAKTATDDDAYSFRPYDRPRRPYGTSAPSVYSESSYAPSHSTARTTPPPSQRGPYTTKDPDKVIIRGVYAFNNAFMKTPLAQLISGQVPVTDGLVLRITTEGWFIDDDVRGVAQREWDVKAWTIKLIESVEIQSLHVVRASLRDQEGKKYVFVLDKTEAWKVTHGLQRLKRGSQVRSLNTVSLPVSEGRSLLGNLGYI